MTTTDTQRIYPKAVAMAQRNSASFARYLMIFKKAVQELGRVNPERMHHVRAVAASLAAIKRGDSLFFFSKIPEDIRPADQQTYQNKLAAIFGIYHRLSPQEKEILELTVWAHDLGIPFGIEWEHHISGAKVARQIIQDEKFREPIAALIYHHGENSNLVSSSFPRDIYKLSRNLQPALFILDFCDASGRIGPEGEHINPIGLNSLEYYADLAKPNSLTRLENPKILFELRFRYGFGPIIFNRSLSEKDQAAMFEQAARLIPTSQPEDLVTFYGSQFRCHFLDILLSDILKTSQERGLVLASIYKVYQEAKMTGEALLWPDNDLGRMLGEDFAGFVQRFKSYHEQHGIKGLLLAAPLESQIKFLASVLY